MNKEEVERAIAEAAERLELYLDQQVEARGEGEGSEQRRRPTGSDLGLPFGRAL